MSFVTKANSEKRVVNDVIYTPKAIAVEIIGNLPIEPENTVLDAFAGKNKVFYDNYPENCKKDGCEIELGRDFFDYKEHVDGIITNPPYSKYTEVMKHSFEIADNIVYLIPLNKIVSSGGRILDLEKYGGIKKIGIYQASRCGFPFGFPACAVGFKKDYKETQIEWEIMKDEQRAARIKKDYGN